MAKGVEKVEAPEAGVEPNNGAETPEAVVVPNRGAETPEAGVELNKGVPPKADDEAPKGDDWGGAALPNNDEKGVEAVGVENREGADVAAAGVEKRRDPLPLDAAGTVADVFVEADAPGAAMAPVV